MAQVVVTLKIMPESPDVNLDEIQSKVLEKVKDFAGETETKTSQEEIGFGLKSLKVIFVGEEEKSNMDPLENAIREIEGVQSVEVEDVRRAFG